MTSHVNQNPVAEVVNADWNFDVLRTYVLGVEILDKRMNDSEFRLLSLLRMRASGRNHNFVSYEKLAEDLGVSESTIKRSMTGLKKKGYVVCSSRGLSLSTVKTITSMNERYDKDILQMSRKEILGSDRTPDTLKRLHGIVDNAPEDPVRSNLTPIEIIEEKAPHTGQIWTPISVKSDPPERSNLTPKVNKENEIKEEVDSTRVARGVPASPERNLGLRPMRHTKEGDVYDTETGEYLTPVVSSVPEKPRSAPLESRDADLVKAHELAMAVGASTGRKGQAAVAKSRARANAREVSGEADETRAYKLATREERQTATSRFYSWFMEEYERFFPDVVMGKWRGEEYAIAKMLIESYSGDIGLVKRAWTLLVEKWPEISKKLKINEGTPTIKILSVYRDRIFSLAQTRKTEISSSGTPNTDKIGW